MDKSEDLEEFEPWTWDNMGVEANFVAQMQARREELGWSQTEFAKRLAAKGLKFHQPTVQRIESGRRPLKLTEALAIADVLGARFEVMLRVVSVPTIYEELVDSVSPGSFKYMISSAENLVDSAEFGTRVAEIIRHYEDAVEQSPHAQVDPELLRTARHFQGLCDEIRSSAEGLLERLYAIAKEFDEMPRNYPPRISHDPEA